MVAVNLTELWLVYLFTLHFPNPTSTINYTGDQSDSPEHIAGEFLAIRRLVASKAGFQAFTHLPSFKEEIGQKVIRALQINNDGVTYAALDMLSTLMIVRTWSVVLLVYLAKICSYHASRHSFHFIVFIFCLDVVSSLRFTHKSNISISHLPFV